MTLPYSKSQLARLLRNNLVQKDVTFSSGTACSSYIDAKKVTTSGGGAMLVGDLLYAQTKHWKFDAIGGMEVGAVPIAIATVMTYYMLHKQALCSFWVRSYKREHGLKKLIEGTLYDGHRVVVVDDVTSKGNSMLKAVQAVRHAGCTVVAAVSLVDRLMGARQLLEENAVEYHSILTEFDIQNSEQDLGNVS